MADVTGVFKADFSSFFDAVEQSQVKLKGLESDSSKVESNLSRMANAFSGQKIIQDATLMAEIFERAGGASAFTEKELARMGATGAEAVEKLQALGKDIPDGIQKIADQSKQATTATSSWGESVVKVAAGYLSLQGLQKVWGFASEIMADADALEDLSAQTKMSTTELQNLGAVVGDFGLDMDQMGRAIFGLSKRIGSGDDSVNDALMQMGLSIKQVKDLDPTELFLTITDAAGQMNGEFKDTAMVTLFGDKIGQVMAGATTDIRGAYDEQVKLNQAIGPDAVKALADADRAIETTYTRLKSWAAVKIFGPLAEDINQVTESGDKMSGWSALVATYLDRVAKGVGETSTRFADLESSTRLASQAFEPVPPTLEELAAGYRNLAPEIGNTAGKTKELADETKRLHDERFNPAETLSGFKEETENAARRQVIIDEEIARNQTKADAEMVQHNQRMAAGEGWMKMLGQFVTRNNELGTAEAARLQEQEALTAENDKAAAGLVVLSDAHTQAGDAAGAATQATVAGYAQVGQQIQVTADGIRAYLDLMRYTAQANSILGQNSLFTSSSQYDQIANIPSFATGVENFGGGLAKVHGGEVLANLPPGTSVFPKGAGLGANISNVFNLVDSESNLARRVSELIMRQIRSGTQLGTA